MTSLPRRSFLAAATATPVAAVALTPGSSAYVLPDAGSFGDGLLQWAMVENLSQELSDRATAELTVPRLFDNGFSWQPPVVELDQIDFLLAFAFGNRPVPAGADPLRVLPDPGPVNADLAATVAAVRAERDVPVYAQWEIARHLVDGHGMHDVVSIEPVYAADGTITYLSTDGVVEQVAASRARTGEVGTAGVVGFRDHVRRCVLTTTARGVAAGAPAGFEMPGTYDPDSAQAWTRDRDLYLVHDVYARFANLRAALLAERYPGE